MTPPARVRMTPPAHVLAVHRWKAAELAALFRAAPEARLHMDASGRGTLAALLLMGRADLLVTSPSGYSMWGAVLSCGVKLGPLSKGANISEHFSPGRHVPWHGRGGVGWLPALRRAWREYATCKLKPACAPSLCSAARYDDGGVWTDSVLNRRSVADLRAAQWLPSLGEMRARVAGEDNADGVGVGARAGGGARQRQRGACAAHRRARGRLALAKELRSVKDAMRVPV